MEAGEIVIPDNPADLAIDQGSNHKQTSYPVELNGHKDPLLTPAGTGVILVCAIPGLRNR